MKKDILTIGYKIPGHSKKYKYFDNKQSFLDTDIIIISLEDFSPSGDIINFSNGGYAYDMEAAKKFNRLVSHNKKELEDFLESGRNIFIFLSEKKEYNVAVDVTSPRKNEKNYTTKEVTNYDFLPIKNKIITASGNKVIFSNNTFKSFYDNFKTNLKYYIYFEKNNILKDNIIVTDKSKKRVLGFYEKVGSGYIIYLPYLDYNDDNFTKYDEKEDKSFWTDEAVEFGNKLISSIISIDKALSSDSVKTPLPTWIDNNKYKLKKVSIIENKIKNIENKIIKFEDEKNILKNDLIKEKQILDLLFEKGKPLEDAVILALNILGYEANNYNDGELELDQVIISPEGERFIGECEGKDKKDIDIKKFRQLLESLNADWDRPEVEEKAYGILFGNPQRLIVPDKRSIDFTKKCLIGAERDKIALVKTTDLFNVAKYLMENKNEKFKKACRKVILDGCKKGGIVSFPKINKK